MPQRTAMCRRCLLINHDEMSPKAFYNTNCSLHCNHNRLRVVLLSCLWASLYFHCILSLRVVHNETALDRPPGSPTEQWIRDTRSICSGRHPHTGGRGLGDADETMSTPCVDGRNNGIHIDMLRYIYH